METFYHCGPLSAYNTYGSLQIIIDNYSAAPAYYNYLRTVSVNGLADCGLGDWVVSGEQVDNAAAATVIRAVTLMVATADPPVKVPKLQQIRQNLKKVENILAIDRTRNTDGRESMTFKGESRGVVRVPGVRRGQIGWRPGRTIAIRCLPPTSARLPAK